ncbi:MAG: ATP-dependent helicase C-terminal domain-containing protein, partial [Planctomycetota bacterium]
RLWDEASHRQRADYETAELHRVDLSASVLRLFAWGETHLESFPWYESPPEASLQHAIRLLKLLGAINESGITEIGKALAGFPVSPRIARLLLECHHEGVGRRGALMAAMLSERDCFLRSTSERSPGTVRSIPTAVRHHSRSDVLDRLQAIEEYLKTGLEDSSIGRVNRSAVRTVTQVAKQLDDSLTELIQQRSADRSLSSEASDRALLKALVSGYPDRVARRRDATGDRGLMVGGRGVRLGPRSAVQNAALFLCVDIDNSGADAVVRQASEVERDWLPQNALRSGEELFFHPTQKQVVARRRVVFDDLVLDEAPASISNSHAAADILFHAARGQLDAVMPNDDDSFSSFVARTRALKVWMPELSVPDVDEAMLLNVLRELCHGRRAFSELRSAPWLATLQSQMDYTAVQTIEREVPERLTVPTGSRIRLIYEEGRPPVLAVRIQEIFGMKQTPRIAGGRIPVLLHLLAPNMRPQQVTDDLASFWANTYADVRRELKRRYPRHPWPEDPLTAAPVKKG